MLKKLLWTLLGLVIVLLLTIIFMLYTPYGLKLTVNLTQQLLPELSLTNVKGSFASTVEIGQLTYQDKDITVSLTNSQLVASPWELVYGDLMIHKLTVQKLEIRSTSSSSESSSNTSWDGKLPLQIKLGTLSINQFTYFHVKHKLLEGNEIVLSGSSEIKKSQQNINANLTWQTLKLYTQKHPTLLNKSTLHLSGPTSDYQFVLQTLMQHETQQANLHIAGLGSLNHINITRLELSNAKQQFLAQGQISWSPQLRWQIQVTAKKFNPGLLGFNYQGTINFELNSKGHHYQHQWFSQTQLSQLSGQFNQQPLSGHLHLSIQGKQFQFSQTEIKLGQSIFQAQGGLNQQWNFSWRLNTPNLNDFEPTLSGLFYSQGRIVGERAHPHIKISLQGHNIHYKNNVISHLTAKLNTVYRINSPIQMAISGANIQVAGMDITRFDINAHGNNQSNQIQSTIDSPEGDFVAKLNAHLQNHQIQGQLTQLSLHSKQLGQWQLKQNAQFMFSKAGITLENFNWVSGLRSVSAQVKWIPQKQLLATLNVKHLALQDLVAPLNHEDPANALRISGEINGQLEIRQSKKQHQTKANINISPGALHFTVNQKQQTIPFQGGDLNLSVNQRGLLAKLNFVISPSQHIIAQLTAPRYKTLGAFNNTTAIHGNVDIQLTQLDMLNALIPDISNAHGEIRSHLTLSGNIKHPRIVGKASLTQGQVDIPKLGLTIQNIALSLRGSPTGAIDIQGQARSGQGLLNITANTHLLRSGTPITLHLSGNNITVANTDEYKVTASPNLDLKYHNQQLQLTGSIAIPKADITPKSFKTNAVSLPSDVEFVQPNKVEQKQSLMAFTSDVTVTLGKEVKIAVEGVTGELHGQLRVIREANGQTSATGAISIDKGKYQAYGTELKIKTGKLIYTGGPLEDPGLNIVATRKVTTDKLSQASLGSSVGIADNFANPGEVLVGIRVTGTAKNYKTSLFSQPPIYSQSDILSMLVLGTPTDKISGASGQLLLRAASELNLGGGDVSNITQQLQNAFGLDELGIQDVSQYDASSQSVISTTSFVVGKRIANRFFLSYSIGLLRPINVLRIRYDLSKRWSVQSESSTLGNGIDLFYRFDRD